LINFSSCKYNYEMWISHRKQFQTVVQKFYQFPKKEYLWNRLDCVFIGNIPYDPNIGDDLKPRNLRFSIFPKLILTEQEMNDYYNNIYQFIELIDKYAIKGEDLMSVAKDKMILSTATLLL
jgi:hypothetical protein